MEKNKLANRERFAFEYLETGAQSKISGLFDKSVFALSLCKKNRQLLRIYQWPRHPELENSVIDIYGCNIARSCGKKRLKVAGNQF